MLGTNKRPFHKVKVELRLIPWHWEPVFKNISLLDLIELFLIEP